MRSHSCQIVNIHSSICFQLPNIFSCWKMFGSLIAAWWMRNSHIFPAYLNWLWLCYKFRPISHLPPLLSSCQISTTAAEGRSGEGTDGRLTGNKKKHQRWQSRTLTDRPAKHSDCVRVPLLLFKNQSRVSTVNRSTNSLLCHAWWKVEQQQINNFLQMQDSLITSVFFDLQEPKCFHMSVTITDFIQSS